jgi:hypothetical protein
MKKNTLTSHSATANANASVEPDLDLDIRNYKLQDITKLFNIPLVFNESDLRIAKLAVLQTHPDKSQLPKEYFLFFSSAYKMLYQVYTFRSGKNRNNKESYKDIVDEETIDASEDSMKLCVDKVKRLNAAEFNKLFNEHYEKCKIEMEEDVGYEDWFRSQQDDDVDDLMNASWDQRVSHIDKKKQTLRENLALVPKNDLQSVNIYGGGSTCGYALGQGAPAEHSSGLFSSLQYEDLKKAHTETVIPITHEDYVNSKKFNNTHDLKVFRDLNLKSFSYDKEEAIQKKNAQAYQDEEDNTHRAFMMAKQDEIAQEMNKKFNGSFLKLLQ